MSTVFEVPCPECGEQMSTKRDGDLECSGCGQQFHVRLGHLFALQQRG